ncbi:TolC family protein [Glaciecola siphonariae]|uniref:TolC family protein n=1 Tax=Glaciecola siphonariae TaxID=521012 RepID=A0ABV9M032_9ALTE
MKFDIFANTALKIVSSSIAALTLFAVVAGQSAQAASHQESINVQDHAQSIALNDNSFARALALVTELEQNLIDANAQMEKIDKGFVEGRFTHHDLLAATVTYFNIENAVAEARVQLMVAMANMHQNQQQDANQTDIKNQLATTYVVKDTATQY